MEISEVINQLREEGAPIYESAPVVKIPNAKEVFTSYMTYILAQTGRTFQYLPVYDEVVDYLTDNKGKGLLLVGNCGTGKTLITRYFMPILYKQIGYHINCFNATDLITNLNEVIRYKLVSVDDLGTESDVSNNYGNKRRPSDEFFDSLEKNAKLGFFSTNLNANQLLEKYKERGYQRLIQCTRQIVFNEESFRGK